MSWDEIQNSGVGFCIFFPSRVCKIFGQSLLDMHYGTIFYRNLVGCSEGGRYIGCLKKMVSLTVFLH